MNTKLIYTLIGAVSLLTVARVDAATIFSPTDGDVNFLLGDLQGGILAMFDDSDQNYLGASLNIDVPGIVGIVGPAGSGNHLATNTNGTLTLTGSDQFILGLSLDNGLSWLADSSIVANGGNSFTVFFNNGGSVLEVDVQVIPLPAAVWLFGSGLLGLTGYAIRRKARMPSRPLS